jgi:hypothetical protein
MSFEALTSLLSLAGTKVTDAGLRELAPLQNLQLLGLFVLFTESLVRMPF